jgi:hypothetical protein
LFEALKKLEHGKEGENSNNASDSKALIFLSVVHFMNKVSDLQSVKSPLLKITDK